MTAALVRREALGLDLLLRRRKRGFEPGALVVGSAAPREQRSELIGGQHAAWALPRA